MAHAEPETTTTKADAKSSSDEGYLEAQLLQSERFLKLRLHSLWRRRPRSVRQAGNERALLIWPFALLTAFGVAIIFLFRQVARVILAYWRKLQEEPIKALVLLLVLSIFGAALGAEIMRWLKPETTVTISAFELTSAPPKVLPITGKTAADLLKDEIKHILDGSRPDAEGASEGDENKATSSRASATNKEQVSARSVDIEEMSEVSAVQIEVEGISLEKIVGLFESIRQDQRHVEGDVIFSGAGDHETPQLQLVDSEPLASACRLSLRARIAKVKGWQTPLYSCDEVGLRQATTKLAHLLMEDLSPHTLALYLQTGGHTDEAIRLLRTQVAREPENVQARVDLAAALDNAHESFAAVDEYRTALTMNPKRPEDIHYRLGLLFFNKEQIETAGAEFKEAIRLNGSYAPPHYGLARQLEYFGPDPEAMRQYEIALRIDRSDPRAHHDFGLALDRGWKTEQAIEELREAVNLDPENAEFHQDLAIELDRHGNLEDAVTEYRQFVKKHPNSPGGHTDLGYALGRQGKYDEAIQEHQTAVALLKSNHVVNPAAALEAVEKDPGASDKGMALEATVHNNLGVAYEGMGDDKLATVEYTKATELNPNFFLAWGNRALVSRRTNVLDEFRTYIDKFRESTDGSANAASCGDRIDDRAQAATRAGDEYRTIGDMESALVRYNYALGPCAVYNPDTYVGGGLALDELGNEQEALAAFYLAEALRDDGPIHVRIGSVLEIVGKSNAALREYRIAARPDARLERDPPDNPEAHRALAGQYAEHGDYGNARRERSDAVAGDTDAYSKQEHDADANWNLALVLSDEGRSVAAIDHLRMAMQIDSNRPGLHSDLGWALEGWNLDDEASNPESKSQAAAIARQEEAMAEYRKSTAGGSRVAHTNLAYALDIEGKHSEAMEALSPVLRKNGADIPALLALGLAYEHARQYPEAIEQYRLAIKFNGQIQDPPEEVDFPGGEDDFPGGFASLCSALNKNDEYEEAIGVCELSLNQEPENADAHLSLGDSLINKSSHCTYCWHYWLTRKATEQYREAARIYEESLDYRAYAETFVTLARAYIGLGRYQDADAQLNRALAWKPIYPEAHHYRGIAYCKVHDTDAANSEFAEEAQEDKSLQTPQTCAANLSR